MPQRIALLNGGLLAPLKALRLLHKERQRKKHPTWTFLTCIPQCGTHPYRSSVFYFRTRIHHSFFFVFILQDFFHMNDVKKVFCFCWVCFCFCPHNGVPQGGTFCWLGTSLTLRAWRELNGGSVGLPSKSREWSSEKIFRHFSPHFSNPSLSTAGIFQRTKKSMNQITVLYQIFCSFSIA